MNNETIVINIDRRDEILAEYKVLRDEIIKRIEIRQQILNFAILILGTLITFSNIIQSTCLILLSYPILCATLSIGWAQIDVRIGEIGEYIREQIEPKISGFGWEKYLRERRSKETFRLYRPTEIAAIGVFFGTEILSIVISWPKITFSEYEIIILLFDLFAIIITVKILQWRRKMHNSSRIENDIIKTDVSSSSNNSDK